MIGYVYKIESDCKRVCYIGSTTQKLSKRFGRHKSIKYGKCSISKYLIDSNYMFSNGCELLKSYEICDYNHLLAYEQLYINKYKNNINEQSAFGILCKERVKLYRKWYRKVNKDKIATQRKEYEYKNKDKIKTRRKEYREQNKDKISAQRKEYESKNKDKIDTQNKEYREKNKEIINSKITCECGFVSSKSNLARHLRTKKHILFLTSTKTA